MRPAGETGPHASRQLSIRRLGAHSSGLSLLAACLAAFATALPFAASAAQTSDVSLSDLQAAARSLGFLDSLTRDGTIVVGFVYPKDSESGKAAASSLADRFRAIPAPNSATFRTETMPADDLAGFTGRLDAIFLAPGATTAALSACELCVSAGAGGLSAAGVPASCSTGESGAEFLAIA